MKKLLFSLFLLSCSPESPLAPVAENPLSSSLTSCVNITTTLAQQSAFSVVELLTTDEAVISCQGINEKVIINYNINSINAPSFNQAFLSSINLFNSLNNQQMKTATRLALKSNASVYLSASLLLDNEKEQNAIKNLLTIDEIIKLSKDEEVLNFASTIMSKINIFIENKDIATILVYKDAIMKSSEIFGINENIIEKISSSSKDELTSLKKVLVEISLAPSEENKSNLLAAVSSIENFTQNLDDIYSSFYPLFISSSSEQMAHYPAQNVTFEGGCTPGKEDVHFYYSALINGVDSLVFSTGSTQAASCSSEGRFRAVVTASQSDNWSFTIHASQDNQMIEKYIYFLFPSLKITNTILVKSSADKILMGECSAEWGEISVYYTKNDNLFFNSENSSSASCSLDGHFTLTVKAISVQNQDFKAHLSQDYRGDVENTVSVIHFID